MPDLRGRYIVETDWLAEHLNAPDLVVLDGSLTSPGKPGDPKKNYMEGHIPGALFFDIDDIKDETNPLPHMLSSAPKFASKVKKMGIGDGMRVIAYDSAGLFSSARVWWMFRAMGHEDVAVLNGGLPKWLSEGRTITDEPPRHRSERHFTPRFNGALVRDMEDVQLALAKGTEQVVDARAAERFRGEIAEPRKGLRSGHMPGARNVPFATLLRDDGTLRDTDELRAIFDEAGVDVTKPITTSCGSGVTAGVLSLALALIGNPDAAVFDGSWTEWGDEASSGDVVTGAA